MINVSVIIPAYNASATLAETVESLLDQTFLDWEALIVDDGSEDDTVTVARVLREGMRGFASSARHIRESAPPVIPALTRLVMSGFYFWTLMIGSYPKRSNDSLRSWLLIQS